MYDVIYIDSQGTRRPSRSTSTTAGRGRGRAAGGRRARRRADGPPGLEQAAELRLRRPGRRPPEAAIGRHSRRIARFRPCASVWSVAGSWAPASRRCARASGVDVTVVEADDERARARAGARSRSRWTAACAQASSTEDTRRRARSAWPTRRTWTTSRTRTRRSRRSSRTSRQARRVHAPGRAHARRALPGLEHVLGADHEARRRDEASPSACSACTSSTPCPCCLSWSSCARS